MKLKVEGEWGDRIDTLDGKPLQNGEKLVVKFPDGTIRVAKVELVVSSHEEQCHNERWTSKDHEAVVVLDDCFGGKLTVSLRVNKHLNLDREIIHHRYE